MMENMGLHGISEHSSEVRLADREAPVWVHDFEAQSQDGAPIDLGAVKKAFQQAFFQVWEGEMEDDGFNRLVLKAGLQWREVTVLRAYGKYLRQARFPFGQDSLEDTLAAYPHITRLILDLSRPRPTRHWTATGPSASRRSRRICACRSTRWRISTRT